MAGTSDDNNAAQAEGNTYINGAGDITMGECCNGACLAVNISYTCPAPASKPPGVVGRWRSRPRCIRGYVFCDMRPEWDMHATKVDSTTGDPLQIMQLPYRVAPDYLYALAPKGRCWLKGGGAGDDAYPVNMRPVVFHTEGPTSTNEQAAPICVDFNLAFLDCDSTYEYACSAWVPGASPRTGAVQYKSVYEVWDGLSEKLEALNDSSLIGVSGTGLWMIALDYWTARYAGGGYYWAAPSKIAITAKYLIDTDRGAPEYVYQCADPDYPGNEPAICC